MITHIIIFIIVIIVIVIIIIIVVVVIVDLWFRGVEEGGGEFPVFVGA